MKYVHIEVDSEAQALDMLQRCRVRLGGDVVSDPQLGTWPGGNGRLILEFQAPGQPARIMDDLEVVGIRCMISLGPNPASFQPLSDQPQWG